jgi:hypothetical protein
MENVIWERRVKYLTETLTKEGYDVQWSTDLYEVEVRRAGMFHSYAQFKKDP